MYRVMRMKLKVCHGMHLVHFLQLVAEINVSGFGKFYQEMNMIVFQFFKDIRKMLKWLNGIQLSMFCSLVAMITP